MKNRHLFALVLCAALLAAHCAVLADPGILTVPGIDPQILNVDPIEPQTRIFPDAQITVLKGSLTADGQIDSYSFTVQEDGCYRFEFAEMKKGIQPNIRILDRLENVMDRTYSCVNGEGITLTDLAAGDRYTIEVEQGSGHGDYQLLIGQPKPAEDISALTLLTDSVTYTDQINRYIYTVPEDGVLRLEAAEMKKGLKLTLKVFDYLDETVDSAYSIYNGEGITLSDLEASETYEIHVQYASGFGSYQLIVGSPRPSVALPGCARITDSIAYTDQRNMYVYTVPEDGCLHLEAAEMKNDVRITVSVMNALDEILDRSYSMSNSEGLTLRDLEAGDSLRIFVQYSRGTGRYDLLVYPSKPPVHLSGYARVQDSIQYQDQINRYTYTAKSDSTCRFELAEMKSGLKVTLKIFDRLGQTVDSSYSCSNGEGVVLKDPVPGENYTIEVCYQSGTGSYELIIP